MSGVTHYAGALRIVRGRAVTLISAGYAACCSGRQAEKIRAERRNTYDPDAVTCKRCCDAMSKHSPRPEDEDHLAGWKRTRTEATIRLDNWHARRCMVDPYTAPESAPIELLGTVTGHPRFEDGASIATGPIKDAVGRTIKTARREYVLGDPRPDYVAWLAEIGKPYDPENPVRMVTP